MPLIQKQVSIAANATNSNILAGDQWEFLSYDAQVVFGFNGAAVGLEIDVLTGNDSIASAVEPLVAASYPNSDEMDIVDMVAGGERMIVKVTNTTGAPIILYYKILITPLM